MEENENASQEEQAASEEEKEASKASTEASENGSESKEEKTEAEAPKTQTLEFWKEASRKHELNSKSNLKKLREAEGSLAQALEERENLTKQIEELTGAAQKQNRENIKLKYGLSELVASRLVGETVEELEADAQIWVEEVKAKKEEEKQEAKKPNLFQGTITSKLEKGSEKSIFAQNFD